jgi:hypothetical protein
MSFDGPGTYQHYKGGQYTVLGLGVEEATHIPVVIYQPVSLKIPDDIQREVGMTVSFWTRPLSDFNATIPPNFKPRFQKIS